MININIDYFFHIPVGHCGHPYFFFSLLNQIETKRYSKSKCFTAMINISFNFQLFLLYTVQFSYIRREKF